MIRKIFSLGHWRSVFKRAFRLLLSPQIPLKEKLWFGVPILLYWILPDVLPYLPFDDIAVTMFVANWFTERIEKKYPIS